MQRLHAILTALLVIALIVTLAVWRHSQQTLQQQLQRISKANGVLRQSLGDLTLELTKKERQIDQMQTSCPVSPNEPGSLQAPIPRQPVQSKPANVSSLSAN